MMGLAPGGSGYSPLRIRRSPRLSADARTRTNSSSGPGSGRGSSRMRITSGPPCPSSTTARMRGPPVSVVGIDVDTVLAQGNQERALVGHEDGAIRLQPPGLHGDDALRLARAGHALGEHLALRVDGVPDEDRSGEPDLLPAEVGHGLGA